MEEITLVPCAFCDGQIDTAKAEHCPKCGKSIFEDPTPPTEFMQLVNAVILQLHDVNWKTSGHGDLSDLGNEIGIALGEHYKGLRKPFNVHSFDDFIRGLKHGLSLADGTHG